MKTYHNEKELVDDLVDYLEISSPWGNVRTNSEFFYQRGKTDVVAISDDGQVIAFEAKLTKWKIALHQAYRNTCFAHRSYVVFPKETALRAWQFAGSFRQRQVGICYFEASELVVLIDSERTSPIQPWLSDKARLFASTAQDKQLEG